MKKIVSALAILVLSFTVNAQINDEHAQVRPASGYHGIHVSSAFNVYLSQSNEEAECKRPGYDHGGSKERYFTYRSQ